MQTAEALSEVGRYDESLKLVEALLSLATQHNCRDRWLLNEAAIVYRDASRYEQAMAVLEETLSQLQQDARPDGYALAYTNGAWACAVLLRVRIDPCPAGTGGILGRNSQPEPTRHFSLGRPSDVRLCSRRA